MCRMKVQCLDL